MSTLQSDAAGEFGVAVVTKGAPDVLLARCTEERLAGEVRPLSEARRSEILATVERLADLALRTLAVAYRPLPPDEPPPEDESVERELVYLGLVGIIDPPRPEAQDGDRRRARRRRARADDHRRPPAHGGADRRRPRHRRAPAPRRHRRRARGARRRCAAQPRCGRPPSTRASRRSTSCASSTRCTPTARSSR